MKAKVVFYPLLSFMLLVSCTPNEGEQSKQSSGSSETIPASLQINWEDSFKQEDEDYLVFYHSDTCTHCHEIMGDVIEFANSNIKKTYFANIESSEGKMPIVKGGEPVIGVSNISDFYIAGTPTLIEIKEGIVTSHIQGKDNCLTFLNNERLNNKN